jgi:uncharacterized DUF497 family protein
MEISFDPNKRKKVLEERGLDLADAGKIFSGRTATVEDTRKAYPEPRFVTAGVLEGRVVVMVWTPTSSGRRIISMRHCHESEARLWRSSMV